MPPEAAPKINPVIAAAIKTIKEEVEKRRAAIDGEWKYQDEKQAQIDTSQDRVDEMDEEIRTLTEAQNALENIG